MTRNLFSIITTRFGVHHAYKVLLLLLVYKAVSKKVKSASNAKSVIDFEKSRLRQGPYNKELRCGFEYNIPPGQIKVAGQLWLLGLH